MSEKCEKCHAAQPRDWQAGQLCVQCGGVVRAERRCAACTQWTPAARYCRHCACELVPDAWYGAARMLVVAGVDGLSLASRLLALDEAQREVFASRFAVQRAALTQHVEAARWVEQFLRTKGHADRLEERWVSFLPTVAERLEQLQWPLPESADPDTRLSALAESAPHLELRELAHLALAWRGHRAHFLAHRHVREDDVLGEEAVLLLAHQNALGLAVSKPPLEAWLAVTKALRVRSPSRPDVAHSRAVALRLANARWRLDEAIGLPADSFHDRLDHWQQALSLEKLEPPLRQGLLDERPSVALGCAVALGDEPTLVRLLESAPDVASVALQYLGVLGSSVLAERLVQSRDEAQRASVIAAFRPPLSGKDMLAVVARLSEFSPRTRRAALQLIEHSPYDESPAEGLAALEAWAARGPFLEADAVWELLRWVGQTGVATAPYRIANAIGPYLDLAVATARSAASFDVWQMGGLFEAGPWPSVTAFLAQALDDEAHWRSVIDRLFSVMGVLHSHAEPPDDRGQRLFMSLWERLGGQGRQRLAPRLAERLWPERLNESLFGLRDALLDWHFAHADERRVSWQALASWRCDLDLRADARVRAIDGGDPVRHFALLSGWSEADAPKLLNALFDELGPDARLTGLVEPAMNVAGKLIAQGQTRLGLWLAASLMSHVVNRFREQPEGPFRQAALSLAPLHLQLERVRHTSRSLAPDDDVSGFDEQMATELRLAQEVVDEEQQRVRQQAQAAAEAEARRLAAEAEAKRQAEATQAAQHQARAALEAAQAATKAVSVASEAVNEVLLNDQPLRTLGEYAAFLKAMQRGGDVMALLETAKMTPQSWGACASAWATQLQQKPQLAMHFMQLLSGP
jgi:hypothetical protein